MGVEVGLAIQLLCLEKALHRAHLRANVVASATTEDALQHTQPLARNGVSAFAFAMMCVHKVVAAALKARHKCRQLLTCVGHMANVVAAAALAEYGEVASNVHATVGAEHADIMMVEEGGKGTVVVEDDNSD